MDSELISKKELLEIAEISYGQLYRWKRKKLIPEEWFIRKSTFTGQETFFPKDKILDRIKKIQGMKEDLSLDTMADMFSPELADLLLKKDEIRQQNIVTDIALNMYDKYTGGTDVYTFEKLLYITVLDKFLMSGTVSIDEGETIIKTMEQSYTNLVNRQCEMLFFRKYGVSVVMILSLPCDFYIEQSIKVVERVNIANCIEELKIKLSNGEE